MRGRVFLAACGIALAINGAAFAQTTGAPVQTQRPAAQAAPQAQAPAAVMPRIIEAQNPLERALITATEPGAGEAQRNAFRRAFVDAQVALAVVSARPNALPAQIEPRPGVSVVLIFTSDARATEVMGADAPRVMLTGRQALERVRGANLVINMNLRPYITLDGEGIEGFLALPAAGAAPAAAARAPAAPARQPAESARPAQ